jgi:uncharacterized membrane protein
MRGKGTTIVKLNLIMLCVDKATPLAPVNGIDCIQSFKIIIIIKNKKIKKIKRRKKKKKKKRDDNDIKNCLTLLTS